MNSTPVICVVGLGYVGLPLAAAFGKSGWKTYGFDVNAKRIDTLKNGEDWTHELSSDDLKKTTIEYSSDPSIIKNANVVIVAVPTPVDAKNVPDLSIVESASESVGKNLSKGSVVVFESTVYPGVTEELCVPILEKHSGLTCGADFTVGYSPERINPGDKEHTIDKITKVVAGQDEATTDRLAEVYGKIVTAGVYKAANIKAAELAKALENTQRDINIALMNEVARFCDKLGIRTKDVLDAAGTKWNFLKFSPGLVGGHCIGVDPYYLVHKANELGMQTDVISAGRKINDAQPAFIADQIMRALSTAKIDPKSVKVLVLGLTFKENVPDTRNAKIHDLMHILSKNGLTVAGHDPWLQEEHITKLGFASGALTKETYDVIILGVTHREYLAMKSADFISALKNPGIFYDVKSVCDPKDFAHRTYLSL